MQEKIYQFVVAAFGLCGSPVWLSLNCRALVVYGGIVHACEFACIAPHPAKQSQCMSSYVEQLYRAQQLAMPYMWQSHHW